MNNVSVLSIRSRRERILTGCIHGLWPPVGPRHPIAADEAPREGRRLPHEEREGPVVVPSAESEGRREDKADEKENGP